MSRPALFVLALLAVAEFMLTLDLSIVNVPLPAIHDDLDFNQDSLQWVINCYALTFGGFLLLGGRAPDLFGGRRVFLAALTLFSASSLACGLAQGPVTLMAARTVQGLSAGVLSPATLSILTDTYREPGERNRALSIWTAVAIGGGAVGALLGGALTDVLSWRWIFFVNVPVGMLLLAVASAHVPHGRRVQRHERLDVAGAITVTAGLTALVFALIRSSSQGWVSAEVIGCFAAAAVLLGAFVVIETQIASAPLVPFTVFRSRLLAAANLASFLSFVPVMATWFFLTLYLQAIRGYTPVQAGLIFLPISLAVVAGSQVSFAVVSRINPRLLFLVGGLLATAGSGLLGHISDATNIADVIVATSITMAGGGLMFAPITVAATAGVEPEQGGLASGLLNTSRQLGGALGLAVLGTVAQVAADSMVPGPPSLHALTEGYRAAFAVGAAIFLATAVIGAFALPTRLTQPKGTVNDDSTAMTSR